MTHRAGGAQHGDEHLGVTYLAGGLADDRHGRPAVVDEQLLAGAVDLAHAAPLTAAPGAVVLAELAVAVGLVAVDLDVLRPQQLQGHALALERLVNLEVVRRREAQRRRLGREQLRLQRRLVGAIRQRPADAGDLRQADVLADHALGEAVGPRNLLVAEASVVLEA